MVLLRISVTQTSLNSLLSRKVDGRSNLVVVSLSAVDLVRQMGTESSLLAMGLGTGVTEPSPSV